MKNYLAFLIFTIVLLIQANKISAQQISQQLQFSGLPTHDLSDLEIDNQNNALVVGHFWSGPTYTMLVKYATDGTVMFSTESALTLNSSIVAKAVCADPADNVIIGGMFSGDSAQLNNGPVFSSNSIDIFVAKYSPTGSLLWAQPFGSAQTDVIIDVKSDVNGNIIFCGNIGSGPFVFGNQTFTSPGKFVAALSPAGAPLWIQYINSEVRLFEMSVDATNNVYITGSFDTNFTMGAITLPGGTLLSPFIAKLSGSGVPLWAKAGSTNPNYHTEARAIDTDNSGNSYVSGYFQGSITFDTTTLTVPVGTGYNSSFILKYDTNGNLNWARSFTTPNGGGVSCYSVQADNTGGCYLTGDFIGTVQLDSISLTGQNIDFDMFICKLSTNGNVLKAKSGGTSHSDSGVKLALGQNNDGYIMTQTNYVGHLFESYPFSLTGFNGYVSEGHSVFRFLADENINTIWGEVFYDTDYNGIRSVTESAASNAVVQINSTYFTYNNGNGEYSAFLDTGNFTISLSSPPLYHTVIPASHSSSFNGFGNHDSTRHFALQPIPGMQDLQVILTSTTVPRPGFDYPLQVTYRNIGTTTLTGSVELQLDSLLTFQNSIPAQTSITGNTLTWNFINLQPTQSATIIINTQVPATAILGTTIHQLASVSPLAGDLTLTDNTDTDSAIVVGSFDPNDKQVNYTSLTPTQVQNQEWLEYTIRFQNTGTDTAFTVRIADTLSTMLNIPTIEVLSSSHPNTWSIKGTGIMEFRFDNILLPDSNTNEVASHGFVKYRIKPKATLALGDVIENTAYIYFDFNAPVVTNTATTEVKLLNSVATLERNPLQIYPNPNKGTFTLQCTNISASQVLAEMRNVLGQIIWQQSLRVDNGKLQQVISTSGLPKGVYNLQVRSEKGSKMQKVVIE